jgi:hypothetical protein
MVEYNNIGKCGNGNLPWQGNSNTPNSTQNIQQAAQTALPFLICPTTGPLPQYTGAPAQLPGNAGSSGGGQSITGAISNYKGMGATQKEYITLAITNTGGSTSSSGSYPPDGRPDGVLFPSATDQGITETAIGDSQSTTIMAVETTELSNARWILGTEATLAGLPSSSDTPGGVTIQQASGTLGFAAPSGFTNITQLGTGWDNQANLLTYINYQYNSTNMYDTKTSVKIGPSSKHMGVTNHLFADGVARPITNTVDVAAYMFLITKNGGESLGNYATTILPP